MKLRSKFQGRLLASTIFASTALVASPALAQDGATAQADAPAGEEAIVITGTLVRNPNLVSSSPVNVVGEEEIELQQANVAEELLRELPGAVPSIGSAVNNGQGGASFVNLRGLGSQRNLVLLDGNRIVPGTLAGQTDLNNIPLALVQRVDVLTGGASTTYGADAVSGVVNFITRRDFAGIDVTASEQITERGDGNIFRVDVTIGANFDDGRGNAVLAVGYQEADAVYQGARAFSTNQISSTSGASAGGSPTSVPTSIELVDGSFLQIGPDGTLVAPYADFNFNPYNIFQTPFERYNIYGAARYEISDTIEVYTRGLFSKNTVSSIIAPSGIFGESLTVPASNPFLSPALRAQLCAAEGIGAAECTAAAGATDPDDPAYLDLTLPAVYRRTIEVGPRVSDFTTTIFDYRAGVIFNITDSINLDVSGSYGESENRQTQSGYVLRSRVQQALDATNAATCLDTSQGCVPLNLFGQGGSITPAMVDFIEGSSVITRSTSLAQARALLSGDFGGWAIPWANEPVGFALGAEYREYTGRVEPDFLSAVPGELGGAGGAVLPTEGGYNVYEAYGELIVPLVQDRPFFNDLTVEAGVRYSSYSVDTPTSPTFEATTWKVGGSWSPIEAVMFRGNYQRAIRAPNIGELFAPVTTGLTNLTTDPCAGAAPTTNANLAAVCIAQGAPAAIVAAGGIQQPAAGQANATGGGNPNLEPETATTWTVGVVIRPEEVVPGFTFSVDYYDIVIEDAIAAATPGDVIAACFDNLTAASDEDPACTGIRRNPVNGRLSGSSATTPGLPTPLTNAGRLETNGIDFTASYTRDLGFAGLNLNFVGNWTDKSRFQAGATSINRECIGQYSVNCGSIQPEWSWSFRSTFTFDAIDVSFLWRHISAVEFERILRPCTGGATPPACAVPGTNPFQGTVTGVGPFVGETINAGRIPAYDYFDLTTRFAVDDNLTFTLAVQNLFDKQPPIVGNTIGSTTFNSGNTYPSTYDALGRRFVATARLRF